MMLFQEQSLVTTEEVSFAIVLLHHLELPISNLLYNVYCGRKKRALRHKMNLSSGGPEVLEDDNIVELIG